MATHFNIHSTGNRVSINGDLVIPSVRRLGEHIRRISASGEHEEIVLDFSNCTAAFSGAMLPICARAALMREQGIELTLILPEEKKLSRLFLNTGWAHFIEPNEYAEPDRQRSNRQFPAVQYKTHEEQNDIVNDMLEKLLAVIPNFNRSAFSAVEWAINEISDNVLNHSQSQVGGFLQLSIFDPRRSRIEFTISDAGIGVPATLREAHPEIQTDTDALLQSVRSGVTRNPRDFQGNGLYGTLEICRVSGGKFALNAGEGALYTHNGGVVARNDSYEFSGTTVDALIDFSEPSLLEKALMIDGRVHRPVDYIEMKYEQEGLNTISFKLDEQTNSFRSRIAGRPVKTKLANLVQACSGQTINVDFGGITVTSSSFADEVFGKLFLELGPMRFMQSIRLTNITPTVQALIDRAIMQRMQTPLTVQSDETEGDEGNK